MTISCNMIPDLLESVWNARNEVVLCLLGQPGIGKTQQIYQFAKRKNANVVELIASQMLPNEISGITMPVDETHSMEIYNHARLSSLKDGDILFFDELLQASPQVLSACLTLIQERKMMSGDPLPDVMIIAAANPLPSYAAIPASIRQRFMFVEVSWNAESWEKYVSDKYKISKSKVAKIATAVSFRDIGYNISTPRTITKLIEWRSKLESNNCAELAMFRKVVIDLYSSDLATMIEDCFTIPAWKESLTKVVMDSIPPANGITIILDSINDPDVTIEEVMAKLQQLPEWPLIMDAMKNITVDGEVIKEEECTS